MAGGSGSNFLAQRRVILLGSNSRPTNGNEAQVRPRGGDHGRPRSRRKWARRLVPVWICLPILGLVSGSTAIASFPGANGMLSYAGDCGTSLRTIDPDGTNDYPLWGIPENNIFRPAEFSADGNRLVFTRLINPVGALYDYDLFILDLRDRTTTRVVQNPSQESFAAWSPDGTKIAFLSNRDTPPGTWQNEIYILDLATGTQTRLTHNALYDGQLDWSPDGKWIVVARGGDASDLIRVDAATGAETNLTATDTIDEDAPSWSPDSSRIVFSRGPTLGFRDIYSITADGNDLRRLTTNSDDERFPVWSPDGARIAFSRGFGPKEDLISIASTGGGERYITHHLGGSDAHHQDCLADWQPCVANVTLRCHSHAPPTAATGPGSGSGSSGTGGGPSAPNPALARDTKAPRLRILSRARLRDRRVASIRVACSEKCTARLQLRGKGRRRLSRSRRFFLAASTPTTIKIRLLANAPRRLARITLTGTAADTAGNRTAIRKRVRLAARRTRLTQ
jgi:hypothetical protein